MSFRNVYLLSIRVHILHRYVYARHGIEDNLANTGLYQRAEGHKTYQEALLGSEGLVVFPLHLSKCDGNGEGCSVPLHLNQTRRRSFIDSCLV
jgi:hypothetical protein